jgi:thiamine biosynthesis lipoprotein
MTTVVVPQPCAEAALVSGMRATVAVTDRTVLGEAASLLRHDLLALDRTCNRLREDSEIRSVERAAGSSTVVSPLLADHLDAALRAAVLTSGLVDPTVATCHATLAGDPATGLPGRAQPAPGWWNLRWDRPHRTILLPAGGLLDLRATAAALTADRCARRITATLGGGALVAVGDHVAVAGSGTGWHVRVGDGFHPAGGTLFELTEGGLATSRSVHRQDPSRPVHHIIDPTNGQPLDGPWRTVSVTAESCLDANIASVAAMVLGDYAPFWLTGCRVAARLTDDRGAGCTVGNWRHVAPRSIAGPAANTH